MIKEKPSTPPCYADCNYKKYKTYDTCSRTGYGPCFRPREWLDVLPDPDPYESDRGWSGDWFANND